MAETESIAKMAEVLSREIFRPFGWTNHPLYNENFACLNQEAHKLKTHPTDTVFSYYDPYLGKEIYLNTDLKSYCLGTIAAKVSKGAYKGDITKGLPGILTSLGKASECHKVNSEWQSQYVDSRKPFEVHSLLFIFNHDDLYKADFSSALSRLSDHSLGLERRFRSYVIGPDRVNYLATVSNDFQIEQASGNLLFGRRFKFYLPDNKIYLTTGQLTECLTIESLIGPFFFVITDDKKDPLTLVYYDGSGDTEEEYIYLFDYLLSKNLVKPKGRILLKMANASDHAISKCVSAKKRFSEESWTFEEARESFEARLEGIEVVPITRVKNQFRTQLVGSKDNG